MPKNHPPGKSRATARRRLGLESLERREVLAGNVLVQVTGGNVIVTGDDEANHIAIYQQENGRFNIIAKDGEVITGPTTNLVIRNLTVNVNGGDDLVKVSAQTDDLLPQVPAQILGLTTINGGTGSNLLWVLVNGREVGEQVYPAMAIALDSTPTAANDPVSPFGDDNLLVMHSSAKLVTVRTGAGDDQVSLVNIQTLQLTLDSGPTTTNRGMSDDDTLAIFDVAALNATVSMGGGDNRLDAYRNLFGNVSTTSGGGADVVRFLSCFVVSNFSLHTSGGADDVEILALHAGVTPNTPEVFRDFQIPADRLPFDLLRLIRNTPTLPATITISTGEGNDVLRADKLFSALAIYIYLDGGNDELRASEIDATIALLFGGLGTDGRLITDVNALTELELQFESVLPPVVPIPPTT